MARQALRLRRSRLAVVVFTLILALGAGPAARPAAAASCAEAASWTTPGAWWDPQVVVDGPLNLRTGPGLRCRVVAALPQGVAVAVTGYAVTNGGYDWVPVSTDWGDGFVWLGGIGYGGATATEVPVLMYHRINDNPGDYEVSPWTLTQQLDWLAANGYTAITPSDLAAAIDYGTPLPPKPVILSIDDGFVSSLGFANALAPYGFRGTYVLPNQASWRLSDADIAWLASTGEVCGHTVDHADLSTLSPDEQWWEIANNKAWLEGIIGAPVTCFAYPYGSYGPDSAGIVAAAGYAIALDAVGGVQPLDGSIDRWHIRRINAPSYPTAVDLAWALGA